MTVPWPDVPMTLFGDDPQHGHLNVSLRWFREDRKDDVTAFREGYQRAAITMAERARAELESPDYLVWPIAWLWRHYLELALKDIIARGPQLEDESAKWEWPNDPNLGHRLRAAWNRARPFIVVHGNPKAPVVKHVANVISDFDRLDPSGMGFRYPESLDGEPSLAGHEDWLNIERIDSTMQAISNFLDAVISIQKQALADLIANAGRSYD